jgi:hypothetical protein
MFMKRKQIIVKCENKLDPHVASYQTPVGPFNQATTYKLLLHSSISMQLKIQFSSHCLGTYIFKILYHLFFLEQYEF